MRVNLMILLTICVLIPMVCIGEEPEVLELKSDGQYFFKNTPLSLDAKESGQQQYDSFFKNKEKTSGDGCTGQVPSRFLNPKSPNIQSSFFKRFSNQDTIETTVLKTGESLVVEKHACDYSSISFRFSFKELPPSLANAPFWFNKTAQALRRITALEGDDKSFNLLTMAKTLDKEIEKKKNFQDFPMVLSKAGDFRIVFQFHRVGYLPKKSGSFVEFDFYEGPL